MANRLAAFATREATCKSPPREYAAGFFLLASALLDQHGADVVEVGHGRAGHDQVIDPSKEGAMPA
jgi:hypothetical protein